jgi:LAO/AO transport system kinase
MLAMAEYGQGRWKPPIVSTTAATRDGIGDLMAAVARHGEWLDESGERGRRHRGRARAEISAIALTELEQRMGGMPGESRLDDLAGRVARGELDPYAAADELISG